MKFWKIFRTEFSYQANNISTQLYLGVLFAFTLFMNVLTTPGDGVFANNTFHLTSITVIGGFIWLVMSAAIAGEAAARDNQTRMSSLIYTKAVTRFDYFAGRFLAAFAVNSLLVFALPLGVLISFYLPGMDEGGLLPFQMWPYLSVFLLIALPNAFVATALQFTMSSLSRQMMTSYLASVVLAIFPQLIAVTAANLSGNWDLTKLLDPIGVVGIVGNEMQRWTPTEKNTRLVTLEGMFLWNRVLWIGLAGGLLIMTYKRFNFSLPETTRRWILFKPKSKRAEGSQEALSSRPSRIVVPIIIRTFTFKTHVYQTVRIARASFAKIARNPAGIGLVSAIALVASVFGDRIIAQFGIPLIPTTPLVLDFMTAPLGATSTPWVVIPLLIMYFSSSLVWNERDARIADIADAAPVTEWTLLTGKFLGLSIMIAVWMMILMIGGILMQASLGYGRIEIGLYLKTLFGLQLLDYLLFGLLALVIHIVANHKQIGYLAVLLAFVFISFPATFQVEHTMLVFAADPGWSYTDMRGFGSAIWPWLVFKVYWIAWALLLAVAGRLLWPRGREQRFRLRLQSIKQNFSGATSRVAIVAVMMVLIAGSFIYYNTNVLNYYLSGSDINQRNANYELFYGKYHNSVQPQLTATRLHVEIHPEDQQVEIRSGYTLVNNHSIEIDSIHLGNVSGVPLFDISFSRAASAAVTDNDLSYYIYTLEQPLKPGDSLQVNFIVRHAEKGFRHRASPELVLSNGTYFTNYDLLPGIGYQSRREIDDPVIRKKFKLISRPALPSLHDEKAVRRAMGTDQNTLDVIVGTSGHEIAVAPGVLNRQWNEGGRNYFHYKSDTPIGDEFAIASSNYAVRQSFWGDVLITIYYHPDHAVNIDRMLSSASASLEYFTQQFGPYPYKTMTIIERAGNGGGASADASMINYGEKYSLMKPDDSPKGFDLPYYILAHEVAHQWWGLARLTPAYVEGSGVLIEGLAVFSGMQVLEKTKGARHLQRYVDYLHSSYEMPRSLATHSLLEANETFLYYRKGGLALHALSNYIGKEKVNKALRGLLEKRTTQEITVPTSTDLYREIQAITPDSLNYLLRDFFETNTYWRLKTKQFKVEQQTSGMWEVTMTILASKVVIDSTGRETDVPMNDWLEVGIYEKGEGENKSLYQKMHRIQSGEQTLKIVVPRKPERGGIDPNYLTIDIRRDDNIMYGK